MRECIRLFFKDGTQYYVDYFTVDDSILHGYYRGEEIVARPVGELVQGRTAY